MSRISVWDLSSPDEYRQLFAEAQDELKRKKHDKLVAYLKNEGLRFQEFLESLGLQRPELKSLDGKNLLALLENVAGYCPGELVEFFRRVSDFVKVPEFADPAQRSLLEDQLLRQISVVADSFVSASFIATDEEDGVRIRSGLLTLVKIIDAGVKSGDENLRQAIQRRN